MLSCLHVSVLLLYVVDIIVDIDVVAVFVVVVYVGAVGVCVVYVFTCCVVDMCTLIAV